MTSPWEYDFSRVFARIAGRGALVEKHSARSLLCARGFAQFCAVLRSFE
jgi:hypothetical protein